MYNLDKKDDRPDADNIWMRYLLAYPEHCHARSSIHVPESAEGGIKMGCSSYCFAAVEKRVDKHERKNTGKNLRLLEC